LHEILFFFNYAKLEFEIRVTVIKIDESLNDFDLKSVQKFTTCYMQIENTFLINFILLKRFIF